MKNKEEDINYKPKNRVKQQAPRGGKYWCGGCDSVYLGVNEKCWHCGYRQENKNFKK